jgi:predicted murein hydrolase (TIGR00659 family)
MNEAVDLWIYLSSSPLFGLTSTLFAYLLAHAIYQRLGQAPLANPVMWSVIALSLALWLTATPYPQYFAGAQFIHALLGPAVVALAWPMWQRRREIATRWKTLLLASVAGGAAAACSAVVIGWALGLPTEVLASLAPKSVTAPVAMGIAERIGGVPALAAVFAVLTGVVGAVSGKLIFDRMGVREWPARGFALGTAAHGIGSARALQVNPEAGAYAGLGLGIQVLLATLVIPLAAWLLG